MIKSKKNKCKGKGKCMCLSRKKDRELTKKVLKLMLLFSIIQSALELLIHVAELTKREDDK